MRGITLLLGLDPLAVVKGNRISWNSILAEIRRALKLKPAFNQYVATLDEGNLTEKQRRNARALKRRWCINDEEWDALEELVAILEPFEAATNDFSKHGRTALHSVLPTYAFLRTKLEDSRSRLNLLRGSRSDVFGMLDALAAGEEKLNKYFKQAQESDLTLIASILHPGMRLSLFEDPNRLGGLGIAARGRTLLEYLYEIYQLDIEDSPHINTTRPIPPAPTSKGFIDSLINLSHNLGGSDLAEELLEYFAGKF